MKNFLWTVIGFLAVLAVGLYVLPLLRPAPSPQIINTSLSNTPPVLPVVPVSSGMPAQPSVTSTSAVSTTSSMSITGYRDITITTKDFIDDPATFKDPLNPTQYYIGPHPHEGIPDPTAATTSLPFVITYDSVYDSFTIVLWQQPLGATRQLAEQYLMTRLGISQAFMCHLTYTLAVPSSVSPSYAGIDLGFSFCPGATQLP